MKLRLVLGVASFNDIITNSSTEILSIKTELEPEILKELLLNYALNKEDEGDKYINPSDIIIKKVDYTDDLNNLFGEITEDEYKKFINIACKRYEVDPSVSGSLYLVEIEHHLFETIAFLQNSLGAI